MPSLPLGAARGREASSSFRGFKMEEVFRPEHGRDGASPRRRGPPDELAGSPRRPRRQPFQAARRPSPPFFAQPSASHATVPPPPLVPVAPASLRDPNAGTTPTSAGSTCLSD